MFFYYSEFGCRAYWTAHRLSLFRPRRDFVAFEARRMQAAPGERDRTLRAHGVDQALFALTVGGLSQRCADGVSSGGSSGGSGTQRTKRRRGTGRGG